MLEPTSALHARLVPELALAAGPFDGIENILQLIMLKSGATPALAQWSAYAAGLKFVCISVALSYVLRVGISRMVKGKPPTIRR